MQDNSTQEMRDRLASAIIKSYGSRPVEKSLANKDTGRLLQRGDNKKRFESQSEIANKAGREGEIKEAKEKKDDEDKKARSGLRNAAREERNGVKAKDKDVDAWGVDGITSDIARNVSRRYHGGRLDRALDGANNREEMAQRQYDRDVAMAEQGYMNRARINQERSRELYPAPTQAELAASERALDSIYGSSGRDRVGGFDNQGNLVLPPRVRRDIMPDPWDGNLPDPYRDSNLPNYVPRDAPSIGDRPVDDRVLGVLNDIGDLGIDVGALSDEELLRLGEFLGTPDDDMPDGDAMPEETPGDQGAITPEEASAIELAASPRGQEGPVPGNPPMSRLDKLRALYSRLFRKNGGTVLLGGTPIRKNAYGKIVIDDGLPDIPSWSQITKSDKRY